MSERKPINQYYDEHTLYIGCGVANENQIAESLKESITNAEKILATKLKKSKIEKLKTKTSKRKEIKKLESKDLINFRPERCRFQINLLVNKDGAYHGYAYVYISDPEIYWMLLGKNPDGSERIEEIPDPDWEPPKELNISSNIDEIIKKESSKTWGDIVDDEDKYIRPKIRRQLPSLIDIPGYKYNDEQKQHLKDLYPDEDIPEMGYFEISRGYACDNPSGTIKNKLCARNVPDWLPKEAFMSRFSRYVTSNDKKYPIIKFINTRKGKLVFVEFDPYSNDSLFALIMNVKSKFVHPETKQECTLIFSHAFDNKNKNNKRRK